MNVAELKSLLESYPDDMEVKFSYNFGDHWRTHVAKEIVQVAPAQVEYSDYHRMDTVVNECEKMRDENIYDTDEGDVDDNLREVLILS